ncbi:GTPase family protein [Trichothermofontia sp.]
MLRLKRWQWVGLIAPIAAIVLFLLLAAGQQIHQWGLNWIWGVIILALVGWRWLLVHWTQVQLTAITPILPSPAPDQPSDHEGKVPRPETAQQAEQAIQSILDAARQDAPLWEDWPTFWRRCQEVLTAVAHVYHPTVKYPLLNIYVPDAYQLLRGTVNDLDRWMQSLQPILNQVTVGQAYQAYEMYQQLEPSARRVLQVWNWSQWLLNPVAAAARQLSQKSSDQAIQQLVVNLGQMLRQAALRNLGRQAIALYSRTPLIEPLPSTPPATAKTQTLREILDRAELPTAIAQQPIKILLVGRTGAGKSSLINTLFQADRATVDVLPSTDQIQTYQWQLAAGESLALWDTPGYEQVQGEDLRTQVLDFAHQADILLLVTPALDPALQMDLAFLKDIKANVGDLPTIAVVTQVDRLRPLREWSPPYDWQWGDRPKEIAIREATQYRAEQLGEWCDRLLPIVNQSAQRSAWNSEALAVTLVELIDPAKQQRLARFLRDREARVVAAANIIDHYTFQMTTSQGITSLLKSPVLQFLSTLATGSPTLAYLLAEQIPIEQLPLVIGKLQMAYDLFCLLSQKTDLREFDLLALWPLLLDNPADPQRTAWAFGHTLVEYWVQDLSITQLRERFQAYLADGAR